MSIFQKPRLSCVALTLALVAANFAFGDGPSLTFNRIVEFLDLEVKEERILKLVEDSNTVFTLGADQIDVLKSKGASDVLIEALRKKSATSPVSSPSASDISDFVLILDASGSMKDATPEGKSKWDVATRAAIDIISAVPDSKNLAFIVYGHNLEQTCNAVEVIRPLSPVSAKSRIALTTKIGQLKPVGHTPIAQSLMLAADELKSATGQSKVILITDGMETCKGDPVAAAIELAKNEQLKGGVNVIGLGLNDNESAAVAKIAKAGHGSFYDARNATDLVKTVKVVSGSIAAAMPNKSSGVKSDARPSLDFNNPTPLPLGQYVSGRLPKEKEHFFTMNLPAGDYIMIGDVELSDHTYTNVGVIFKLDGKRLHKLNEIDRISRAAAQFHVDGGTYVLGVQSDSGFSIYDYRFAVYRATDDIPNPYLDHAEHKFTKVELGKPISMKFNQAQIDTHYALLHARLDEGDYLMTVTLSPTKQDGAAYGVTIEESDPYGMAINNFPNAIAKDWTRDKFLTIKTKLIIAEPRDLRMRIKTTENAECEGKLTITKIDGSEAK